MANSTTEKTRVAQAQPASIMAVVAPAVGWLIPGAGHMIQKRWIRGLLLFVSIATLFVLGLAMQGRIYKANGGDILDILGVIGDVGAGGLYIELGSHWDGFGKRAGIERGEAGVSHSLEAGLGAIWGEDPRYYRKAGAPFKDRLAQVIKMTFFARNREGGLMPA